MSKQHVPLLNVQGFVLSGSGKVQVCAGLAGFSMRTRRYSCIELCLTGMQLNTPSAPVCCNFAHTTSDANTTGSHARPIVCGSRVALCMVITCARKHLRWCHGTNGESQPTTYYCTGCALCATTPLLEAPKKQPAAHAPAHSPQVYSHQASSQACALTRACEWYDASA